MDSFRFTQSIGSDVKAILDEFYFQHGGKTKIAPNDLCFMVWDRDHLIGNVRFCIEEGVPLLRSMMIAKEYRKKKIGFALLEKFQKYLDENHVREIFCLPYDYLEAFYGTIGFQKAADDRVPRFLFERLTTYRAAGNPMICMWRTERNEPQP